MRNEKDTFGAFYDPKIKTKQVLKLEKLEKESVSTTGSNIASFYLARRARFLEQDRVEEMMKQEEEEKRRVEREQIREKNKYEAEKLLKKNQLRRQKKKQRKEMYEKRQQGLLPEVNPKKIVRDESAVKAVSASITSNTSNTEEKL